DLSPQTREKVSDEFCDAVDRWLGHASRELGLTPEGKNRFGAIIAELLDNAERHSVPETKDGSWSVAAFMARRIENRRSVFRCYMAFLSVGASVSQSLATAPDPVRADIDRYCARHINSG